MRLRLKFTPNSGGACTDIVKLTVVRVDLDAANLPDEDEQTAPGRLIAENDDFDENKGDPNVQRNPDHADASPVHADAPPVLMPTPRSLLKNSRSAIVIPVFPGEIHLQEGGVILFQRTVKGVHRINCSAKYFAVSGSPVARFVSSFQE